MSSKHLVVIDGKSVFYRGYYAMPNLATKEGTTTGGVYGFAVMALEIVKKMNPDFVCVAWDKPKTNIRRRKEIYPEYKANRKPAPPDFYEQIPLLHELLAAFGWPLYEIDDHEADDIMATFAKQAHAKKYRTTLITSDHDVLQTVTDDTTVAILRKGLTNVEYFDPAHFEDYYSMTTDQFIDYKSLRGDPSDNLPGVAGVGEKTATTLIDQFGSLDGIYEHVEEIKGATQKKLIAGKDDAYLTKQLVILEDKVPLELDWKAASIANVDPAAVVDVLKKFEFRSLLNQLPEHMKQVELSQDEAEAAASLDTSKITVEVIAKPAELKKVNLKGKELVVHAQTAGAFDTQIEYVLLSAKPNHVYVVQFGSGLKPEDLAELQTVLEDSSVAKIGYDIKATIRALRHIGITLTPIGHDIRLGSFLINSLTKEQSLTALAQNEFGYEGESLDNVSLMEASSLAPMVVGTIWGLHERQVAELEELPKVKRLAKQVEWPVMEVLASMEHVGIQLDTKYLATMSEELLDTISDLEQHIYGHVDKEFNISSPLQLAEVLYKDLGLPTATIKKTKTGFSTAASELAKLQALHPIIELISQYREVTKLKSTYVDALPKLVDEQSKLHTTFSMAVASTGRLSSHDPNLQNIPARTELGRTIRKAFVAPKGRTFIQADYSQFELRIAAALSGDDSMISAFNSDIDIHAATAAAIHGIEVDAATKEQRYSAKAVNFGILYGQGPHGLSQGTGMSMIEAREFIDRYFEIRPKLKTYLDGLRDQAKNEGFVETALGRRRPTPDVRSNNFAVREGAYRAAVNMPIQGTAADLTKLAMIAVNKKLPKGADQILQIHDSIMIECDEADAEAIAAMMVETMEGIYDLGVTLKVDYDIGASWGEL